MWRLLNYHCIFLARYRFISQENHSGKEVKNANYLTQCFIISSIILIQWGICQWIQREWGHSWVTTLDTFISISGNLSVIYGFCKQVTEGNHKWIKPRELFSDGIFQTIYVGQMQHQMVKSVKMKATASTMHYVWLEYNSKIHCMVYENCRAITAIL